MQQTSPSSSLAIRLRSLHSGRRGRGFTLIEAMLGLVILGMAAVAALSALLFSYRVSDANLRSLAAAANARSVAEKVITLDFATLAGTTLPVDIPSRPDGSLTIGEWNARLDDIHNTPDNPDDDLVLNLRPEVAQSQLGTGFNCSQVILRYRWEESSIFVTRTHEDVITFMMSNVPSY